MTHLFKVTRSDPSVSHTHTSRKNSSAACLSYPLSHTHLSPVSSTFMPQMDKLKAFSYRSEVGYEALFVFVLNFMAE